MRRAGLGRTGAGAVVLLVALVGAVPAAGAGPDHRALGTSGPTTTPPTFFAGCLPPAQGPLHVVVGQVTCQERQSADLGGVTAFSYYVPPGCAPAALAPGRRCPVLYLLHGFGGDYTSELGTAAHPSAMVSALNSGPPVDPTRVPDPWDYANPSRWVPMSPLDMILVAPDGRTVPGGFGPAPGLDGFWMDWNPRYARGGSDPRYATPAPEFEASLLNELIPYVDATFPAGGGRAWQALQGTSLGGFGAYKDGLQHPDEFASIGAISGAMNFLVAPGPDPVGGSSPVGVTWPGGLPYVTVPGAASQAVPVTALGPQAADFAIALYAFGDPVADQAYYRGNMPRDLAGNGHAAAAGTPSLDIRGFSNDAVPRRAQDVESPGNYLTAQAFEALVLDMNVEMESAFADQGVPNSYQLHPGIHSDVYWDPFFRQELAGQYAHLRHSDGAGAPPPWPTSFSYRTISDRFAVWGWQVTIRRADLDVLSMSGVSCQGLTLRGTGTVNVEVPSACGTGLRGRRGFTVDLGPSAPIDDGADAAALGAYGRTVHVTLSPR